MFLRAFIIVLLLVCATSSTTIFGQTKTVPYFHQFDSDDSWVVSGTPSVWARGDQTNGSFGPASGHSDNSVYGTKLNVDYAENNIDAFLTTPNLDLAGTTQPVISFWMDLESESSFDGGTVQIAVNGGAYVTILLTDPGYLANAPNDTDVDGLLNAEDGWAGTQPAGSWMEVAIDVFNLTTAGLSGITAADDIKVRFWFGTDGSVNLYPGWYIDDFCISKNNSPDATSTISTASNEMVNIAYATKTAASITAVGDAHKVWSFTATDAGTADGLNTNISAITINKGASDGVADWGTTIKQAAIYDGTTEMAEISVTASGTMVFTGIDDMIINDGTGKTYDLYLTFETTNVVDNEQFQFKITNADVTVMSTYSSSSFGAFTANSSVAGNDNRIEVTATKYVFNPDPPNGGQVGQNIDFTGVVEAQDANNILDLDNTCSIILTKASGTGSLSSVTGLTQSLVAGKYTWSDLQYNTAENFTINADENGACLSLTAVTSGSITCLVTKTLPYSHKFDSDDSWTTTGTAGIWARGDQTNGAFGPASGHSGNTVYGTKLNANYGANNIDAFLVSPSVSLLGSTQPMLKFWMDLESEGGFDGGTVQISVNGGTFTTVLLTDPGYTSNAPNDTDVDGCQDAEDGWSGTQPSGDWQEVILDLFALTTSGLSTISASDLIQVQFWFGTDGSLNSWPGWYIDDFIITKNNTVDADGTIVTAANEMTDIDYAAKTASSITGTGDAHKVWSFTINDLGTTDGLVTDISALTITQGASNGIADWGAVIKQAAIYDGATEISEISATTATNLAFSGITTMTVNDGASKTYDLYLTFETSGITDNSQFQFKLANTDVTVATFSTSSFAASTANSDVTGDKNRIEVSTTKYIFNPDPPSGGEVIIDTDFSVVVNSTDGNNILDLDNTCSVTLTKNTGTGTLSSVAGLTQSLIAGVYTWTDIRYDVAETFTINVDDGACTAVGSTNSSNILGVSGRSTPYVYNFDNDDVWTTSGDALWSRGNQTDDTYGPPSGKSGNTVFGVKLNALVTEDNQAAYIQTPKIKMPAAGNPILCFWQDMESEAAWDGGTVQISVNGGAYTTLSISDPGYTLNGPNDTDVDGLANLEDGWSGNQPAGEWEEVRIDLLALTSVTIVNSDNVNVQFWFGTDGSGDSNGWYIDDFCVTKTNSTDATSTIATGGNEVAGIAYGSYQASSINSTSDGIKVWSFAITDAGTADGIKTDITGISIVKGASDAVANWGNTVRQAALYDGTTELGEVSVTAAGQIDFTGLTLELSDGASKTLDLYFTFESTVVDNEQFQFKITNTEMTTEGFCTSTFGAFTASSDVTGTNNEIVVSATAIGFGASAPLCTQQMATNFNITVNAVDALGNVDKDAAGTITLSKSSGTGVFNLDTDVQTLANGTYAWTTAQMDTEDQYVILATHDGSLGSVSSCTIDVWDGNPTTVCAVGCDYTTIEAAYVAFAATLTQKEVIVIKDGYTPASEAYPITLGNKNATSTNTVSIVPHWDCTAKNITDAATPSAIFNFSGGDYITIDGRAGRTGSTKIITIENTSTTSSEHAVEIQNNSDFNTVKYCIIKSSNRGTSSGGGVVHIDDASDNNVIDNCIIRESSGGNPLEAVTTWNLTTSDNTTISNNEIINFERKGIAWYGYQDGTSITNNHFYQTADITGVSSAHNFIYIDYDGGHTITGNFMGGKATSCGGAAYVLGSSSQFFPIEIGGNVSGTKTTIDNNTLANIAYNSTYTTSASFQFIGFFLNGSSDIDVGTTGNGNTIGATSGTGSIVITNNSGSANDAVSTFLRCNSTGTINVKDNTFGAITIADGTNTNAAQDFFVFYIGSTATGASLTIDNNTIGNSDAANMIINETSNVYGLLSLAHDKILTFTNNTVQNFQINQTGSTNDFIGFYEVGAATDNTQDKTIDNNTFTNIISESDGTNYAIYFETSDNADANQTHSISGNTISNLTYNNTGTNTIFRGIYVGGKDGSNPATYNINSNTIQNINYKGSYDNADPALTGLRGIRFWNTAGSKTHSLSQNVIDGFNCAYSGSNTVSVIALYATVNSTATLNTKRNKIKNLTSQSTGGGASHLTAIWITDGIINAHNNLVWVDNSTFSNDVIIYGIRDGSNDTREYYHNSVNISGLQSGTTTSESICFWRELGGTINVRNNAFRNQRTNQYSRVANIHLGAKFDNTATITLDYNYLRGNSGLGNWGGTTETTLASWKITTGQAANSVSGYIGIDANGMLADPSAVKDAGVDLTGTVADDVDATARIAPVWIGSFEGGNTVLPVTLTSFELKCVENGIKVKWNTSSEFNSDRFDIYHTSDLELPFTKINEIEALGNSTSNSLYQFVHDEPADGLNFYKLIQVDNDGRTEEFQTSLIKCETILDLTNSYVIFPNPTNDLVNIIFEEGNLDCTIEVYDAIGQIVRVNPTNLQNENKISLNLKQFGTGLYYIKIISQNYISLEKIIVE